MSIERVNYFAVTCDFPIHISPDRSLRKADSFHYLSDFKVVCDNCWDDLMTVESLLDFIKVKHTVMTSEEIPIGFLE